MSRNEGMRFRTELEEHLRLGTCSEASISGALACSEVAGVWKGRAVSVRRAGHLEDAAVIEALCARLSSDPQRQYEWRSFETQGDSRPLRYQVLIDVASRDWIGILRHNVPLLARIIGPDDDDLYAIEADQSALSRHARFWEDRVSVELLIRAEIERGMLAPSVVADVIRGSGERVRLRFDGVVPEVVPENGLTVSIGTRLLDQKR